MGAGVFFCLILLFRFILLRPEGDGSGCGIHGVNDGKGFQLIAKMADDLSPVLKALFYSNADALHGSPCLLYDGNQTLQGAAVGQEIVNDQHMVLRA